MRFHVTLVCAFLIYTASLGGQTCADDPYSIDLVRANLRNVSAGGEVGPSSVVKYFQRLGDGVSIALLKILDEKDLTDSKTVESFLPLIRHSFSYPLIISPRVNREPKVTLFLLRYLEKNVSDGKTRRDVQETTEFVRRRVAISQTQQE